MYGRNRKTSGGSLKMSTHGLGRAILAVLTACLLAGCAGPAGFTAGKTLGKDDRILLAGEGKHSGVLKNLDMTLNYQYTQKHDALDLSGAIKFEYRISSFFVLDYYHMDIYFADANGTVLTMQPLMNGTTQTPEQVISFSKSLKIPSGAKYMAFGYSGQVENTQNGDSRLEFTKYPIQ
jgi:hypothetical protein